MTPTLQLIRSAVKGKAPIAAIPLEGNAPVCVDRKRLAAWCKGLTLTRAEVETHYTFTAPRISWEARRGASRPGDPEGPHERSAGARTLVIEGSAGYARRSRCRMVAIDRRTAVTTLAKWTEKERVRIQKKIMLGALGTAQKKAMKLAAFGVDSVADGDTLVTSNVYIEPHYRYVLPRRSNEISSIHAWSRPEGPEERILVKPGGTFEVTGALVRLPGLDEMEFVIHRTLARSGEFEAKGWAVTERRSGLSAAFGDTAEAALMKARTNVSGASVETLSKIRQRVAEQAAKLAA